MNVVKREILFNKNCLHCLWRCSDIHKKSDMRDDCLKKEVLAIFSLKQSSTAVVTGLMCRVAIQYCMGTYFFNVHKLVVEKLEQKRC